MPNKPKQPKNFATYDCSTLAYQYQEITNNMGTIPPRINPNLKFYIGQHSNHIVRPK
jgi:hypothetical protein